MFELRYLNGVLQFRSREIQLDSLGFPLGVGEWSEWQDVPEATSGFEGSES
jgi:hypothetical protein